ncbi:endonuclease G, mitochondrial-like [Ostrea edulis]|uniref:endonuclease G, mitochondrial-like n=1 Tax=Ostrea edulis TaxID=37623 RepID=UPI0024AF2AF2|nr:endonuclease G, mitochondrial-like [Ostrea edulis]
MTRLTDPIHGISACFRSRAYRFPPFHYVNNQMSHFGKLVLSTTCTGLGIVIGSYCGLSSHFHHQSNEKLGDFKDDNCVTASPLSETLKSYLPVSTVCASCWVGIKPKSPNPFQEISVFEGYRRDPFRTFENYVVHYDRRNKVPRWVFEIITKEQVDKNDNVTRNACSFTEDLDVHPFFRSTNADYEGSGYDRGHMAAASNHRNSQKAMNDTFCLSNIAPQVGKGFNQGVWKDLEKYTRALARKYTHVYVCSGPLYLPSREADGKLYVKYEVIGKNHVSVPTHFFKVIVMENDKGEFEMNSFKVPNENTESTPLTNFLAPIEEIERAAGFMLFEGVPKRKLKKINGMKV